MKFTLIHSPSYGNNYPPSTHPHTYHIMTTTSTCRMHWGVKSSINKRMLLETTNGNQRTPATTQPTGTSKGTAAVVPVYCSLRSLSRWFNQDLHSPSTLLQTHPHHPPIAIIIQLLSLAAVEADSIDFTNPNVPSTHWISQFHKHEQDNTATEQGQNIPRTRTASINSTYIQRPPLLVGGGCLAGVCYPFYSIVCLHGIMIVLKFLPFKLQISIQFPSGFTHPTQIQWIHDCTDF